MLGRIGASSLAALVFAVSACAVGNGADEVSELPSPTPYATTVTTPAPASPLTFSVSTTTIAPTITSLPGSVETAAALAWGLFCRDLADAGWGYPGVVAYWDVEGRPARMDADEDGIPCETLYPASDVTAYWGDPLPDDLKPGPGSGWVPSARQAPVTSACCSMNHNGVESPPLPPATGAFADDGAFSVAVTPSDGPTDYLELEVRRWLPCSEHPDRCSPDFLPGDVYADPETSVTRRLPLDENVIVVIRPIGHFVGNAWTDLPSIEGVGATLATLLRRIDAAFRTFVEPAFEQGRFDFQAAGAADPTFPYGSTEDGHELGYRGPEGVYLTPGFHVFSQDQPVALYGWWPSLEIVDGVPVLYLWAGQIAG